MTGLITTLSTQALFVEAIGFSLLVRAELSLTAITLNHLRSDCGLTGPLQFHSPLQHGRHLFSMNYDWNQGAKPPRTVCPKQFCFHWAEAGDRVTGVGRMYNSLDEAIDDTTAVDSSRCACAFGVCTRNPDVENGSDWYEPNERTLESAGLPWFYFIASVDHLGEQFHERYIKESIEIWGEHDGLG